jgi:hypothetical protein
MSTTVEIVEGGVRVVTVTPGAFNAEQKEAIDESLAALQGEIDGHEADLVNPHQVTKAQVGLSSADDTSDADKPVSTAQAAADAVVLAAARAYSEGLVVGLWDDRGNFDASVNTFPAAGGSGPGGVILKGDMWNISVAGVLGGVPVAIRQTVRALIDAPGQDAANWAIGLSNADIDDAINAGVVGRAPSQRAVYEALYLKADKSTLLMTWAYAESFRLVSATRNGDGAITTAEIAWPDGTAGAFTADVLSGDFPGAIDAWHATSEGAPARTVTQATVTRDAFGAVISQPAITTV